MFFNLGKSAIAWKLDQLTGMKPRLREFFAHSNSRFTTRMQRGIHGHVHATHAEPLLLNEERAVKPGLSMIGKLAVVSVAGAAVTFAAQGSAKVDAGKPDSPRRKLEEPHCESMEERFEAWVAKYGRTYKDEAEKGERFKIFKETAQYVDSLNKAGDKLCTFGTTEFADISDKEFLDYVRGRFNPWDESITGVPSSNDGKGRGCCSSCNENTTAAPASMDGESSC